jgi:hypothetical protein
MYTTHQRVSSRLMRMMRGMRDTVTCLMSVRVPHLKVQGAAPFRVRRCSEVSSTQPNPTGKEEERMWCPASGHPSYPSTRAFASGTNPASQPERRPGPGGARAAGRTPGSPLRACPRPSAALGTPVGRGLRLRGKEQRVLAAAGTELGCSGRRGRSIIVPPRDQTARPAGTRSVCVCSCEIIMLGV